ncbi:MAG: redoxin domain-containing protein [Terriglobales bacterium]|jgi:tetratricopeptide (TPR) repeat protein
MTVCRSVCCVLAFLFPILCAGAQTGAEGTSAVDQEIQSGDIAVRQGRYAEAKQHFERAERLGGPPSAEINAGIAIAELQMDHFEAARKREAKVLELVSTNHDRAEAYNLIGTAWLRESAENRANLDMLHSAEASFQQAVKLDPVFDSAFFNLGNALLREKRDEEAAAAFKSFVGAAANNPAYEHDLPLTPRAPAPGFNIPDSEGRVVASDSLSGRFVLLDYWATWCGPCLKALPAMRQLAHYFPPDQFVLISVDEDSPGQQVWRKFIVEQKMDWTQVWDKDGETYHNFGLTPRPDLSIPRYVLIDREGYVRRVYDGIDQIGLVVGQIARIVADGPKVQQGEANPAAK